MSEEGALAFTKPFKQCHSRFYLIQVRFEDTLSLQTPNIGVSYIPSHPQVMYFIAYKSVQIGFHMKELQLAHEL